MFPSPWGVGRSFLFRRQQWRGLLTLAIETSCDDTAVAILEKYATQSISSDGLSLSRAVVHFNEKITADNSQFRGIHPVVASISHQSNLANLVDRALKYLPAARNDMNHAEQRIAVQDGTEYSFRQKPDFISVTRGPGMFSSLRTGLDMAKGLAVAYQVPLVGVNHMQAHALTPRLVSALEGMSGGKAEPDFPFLSLLVSGGHTMLIHSKSLNDHEMLANSCDIAIGDFLDKIAREIVPGSVLKDEGDIMYGRVLEKFIFPNGVPDHNYSPPASMKRKESKWGWGFAPPLLQEGFQRSEASMKFSFTGLGSAVERCLQHRDVSLGERIDIGQEAMRVAFEHLVTRVIMALEIVSTDASTTKPISTVVISGGVASNQYLRTVLRSFLNQRGYSHVKLIFPPPALCTDNAAMIAWAGMEMFEAGWESELTCGALRKWSMDPSADGGILGTSDWKRRRGSDNSIKQFGSLSSSSIRTHQNR